MLAQLRAIARDGTKQRLIADLREARDDGNLAWFLQRTERDLADLYRSSGVSWTAIRREAGRPTAPTRGDGKTEEALLRAMRRLQHLDDPERNARYREWLARAAPPTLDALSERDRRLLRMLVWGVGGSSLQGTLAERADLIWGHRAVVDELGQLLEVADASSAVATQSAAAGDESPSRSTRATRRRRSSPHSARIGSRPTSRRPRRPA